MKSFNPLSTLGELVKRWQRETGGVAALEFGLILPLLLLLLFGAFEIARMHIIHQKMDKIAFSMADMVTQSKIVCDDDIRGFMVAAVETMKPYSFYPSGKVAFSSVINSESSTTYPCEPLVSKKTECISWQATAQQGQVLGNKPSPVSKLGKPGSQPNRKYFNAKVQSGYNLIAAEVLYNYEPLLNATSNILPMVKPAQLYKTAIMAPRLGVMESYCNTSSSTSSSSGGGSTGTSSSTSGSSTSSGSTPSSSGGSSGKKFPGPG